MPPSILLVEDDPVVAKVLSLDLREADYQVRGVGYRFANP
jgi:CheY-like chemotaxis protein